MTHALGQVVNFCRQQNANSYRAEDLKFITLSKALARGKSGSSEMSSQSSPIDVHTSADNSNALSDISSASGGNYHTCALTLDSTVKCWGEGTSGRLGNGATDNSSYPRESGISDEIGERRFSDLPLVNISLLSLVNTAALVANEMPLPILLFGTLRPK